ncbi:hypothetical protein Plhal703r1_c25g0106891 [Plasmopara halstedii]
MRQSAQDSETHREDDDEMNDDAVPMTVTFSTPRRKQQKSNGSFKFSVTPEPSRNRLSTYKGRNVAAELEESPARYSPGKVKKAVRSFAQFLHFLSVFRVLWCYLEKQDEHHQEHELMPLIIQRFAELGAVIESQKRHIDRWKGKELDLAIEEAQQNMELVQALGEQIQTQELQIADLTVKGQQWEEKYQLAAQEIEILKKQGTFQIQQLQREVTMLRQAGVQVEKKLKDREVLDKTTNDTLLSQLEQFKRDSGIVKQENTRLKQQLLNQSNEMHAFEQQTRELQDQYEAQITKTIKLEQDAKAWQVRYQEENYRVDELNKEVNRSKDDLRQREIDWKQLVEQNRKLQEHVDRMAQEHEKQLADQHKHRSEVETERQRLTKALEQESLRFKKLSQEANQTRAQIEAQAMAAMKERERQLLDEKARVEDELQHQFHKINEENIELRATVENLKDMNRRKSTEIGRLMTSAQEVEKQNQSRIMEAQKMQQLAEEAARAKHQLEILSKELAAKHAAQEEAMKVQSAEFENQYNDFVSQVENQFNEMTHENGELRARLEETVKTTELLKSQSVVEKEELSRCQTECTKLQRRLEDGSREYGSLKQELENHVQELELRNTQNAHLSAQIAHLMSSDNERKNEMDLLQAERLRLEERNQDSQRLVEETRAQAEALMEEAHRVHDHSIEQQATHDNTVRLLHEEIEAINRNLMTLLSEKETLEAQITTDRTEIDQWKTSVQQLEHDKRQLKYQMEELMRQATEKIESQKQSAAMVTKDGQSQLQKLTSQLLQCNTQIIDGQQQLRNMQELVRSHEEKILSQQYEVESLQLKNEQLSNEYNSLVGEKREFERKLRQHGMIILREGQFSMEDDICQILDRLVREMDRRIKEEEDKAVQLQVEMDSKVDTQVRQMDEERVKLSEENARLQQDLGCFAAELEKLDSELLQLQQEREEREESLNQMQQTIAAYEEDRHTQSDAIDASKRLDASYKELSAMYEQYKQNMTIQLEEKDRLVIEMQDDMAELQTKLEQEKEMTRHLMESSQKEKHEHSKELFEAKERQRNQVQELEASVKDLQNKLSERKQSDASKKLLQAHVKELETSVKRLQHELAVSQQATNARDQSAMHESLQKEREYRALQAQHDTVMTESAEIRKNMKAKLEEIDRLYEENKRLHEVIKENTVEIDSARSQLHLFEQLTRKLEKLQDDLAAREDERRQHYDEMSAKEKELQHSCDTAGRLKRYYEDAMHEKDDETVLLKKQNAVLREQLKKVEQTKASTNEAHTAAQEEAKKELKQACDQSAQREQELLSQIAQLEASRMSLLHQFRYEMMKLNVEIGEADADQIDDKAFHRGILEVSVLLRSFQERESRQIALVKQKEKLINELNMRLEGVEHSSRICECKLSKRDNSRERKNMFFQQVEDISNKMSKLKVENQKLRDHCTTLNNKDKRESNFEWKERCAKLQKHVRDLNTKLKENYVSKNDIVALEKEVENLTNQMVEKDMQLQSLRETQRMKNRGEPRRPRDLLEEKVMALNDHLTGLMTENMQLQHSIEQYAVQYGPLDTTKMTGVIGNSGIQIPA